MAAEEAAKISLNGGDQLIPSPDETSSVSYGHFVLFVLFCLLVNAVSVILVYRFASRRHLYKLDSDLQMCTLNPNSTP
jgi:hypothetical protein